MTRYTVYTFTLAVTSDCLPVDWPAEVERQFRMSSARRVSDVPRAAPLPLTLMTKS